MPAPIPGALGYQDDEGDYMRVSRRLGGRQLVHLTVGAGASACHMNLSPEQCRGLAEYLLTLVGEGEVADMTDAPLPVDVEARSLVYGDREEDYGHPRQGLTRIAAFWSVALSDKLGEGEFLTPEDVARLMVLFKVSRDISSPKRDNRVDGIGYLLNLDRLETGR